MCFSSRLFRRNYECLVFWGPEVGRIGAAVCRTALAAIMAKEALLWMQWKRYVYLTWALSGTRTNHAYGYTVKPDYAAYHRRRNTQSFSVIFIIWCRFAVLFISQLQTGKKFKSVKGSRVLLPKTNRRLKTKKMITRIFWYL